MLIDVLLSYLIDGVVSRHWYMRSPLIILWFRCHHLLVIACCLCNGLVVNLNELCCLCHLIHSRILSFWSSFLLNGLECTFLRALVTSSISFNAYSRWCMLRRLDGVTYSSYRRYNCVVFWVRWDVRPTRRYRRGTSHTKSWECHLALSCYWEYTHATFLLIRSCSLRWRWTKRLRPTTKADGILSKGCRYSIAQLVHKRLTLLFSS